MSISTTAPFAAGRFLMTPLTRLAQGGAYIASLSIRSGRGSQTHDRIYTFRPEFATPDSALHYAAGQGRQWIANPLAFA